MYRYLILIVLVLFGCKQSTKNEENMPHYDQTDSSYNVLVTPKFFTDGSLNLHGLIRLEKLLEKFDAKNVKVNIIINNQAKHYSDTVSMIKFWFWGNEVPEHCIKTVFVNDAILEEGVISIKLLRAKS